MNLKQHIITGATILVFSCVSTAVNAQRVYHPPHQQKEVQKATVDQAQLKATYDKNLIKDYERAIGKKVVSKADYQKMSAEKKNDLAAHSVEILVVADPLKSAQTYFKQLKGN